MMKLIDKGLLIVVAVVCAIAAWAFFNFFGQTSFEIYIFIFVIYMLIENYILKKELNKHRAK